MRLDKQTDGQNGDLIGLSLTFRLKGSRLKWNEEVNERNKNKQNDRKREREKGRGTERW